MQKKNQHEEFLRYIIFIASLNKEEIIKLVKNYKEKKLLDKELKVAVQFGEAIKTSNEKEEIHILKPIPFPLKDLISFLEKVQATQDNEYPIAIEAQWDKNISFLCHKDKLATYLKKADIGTARFLCVSLGFHLFAIERTKEGFYLFEPNNISRSPHMKVYKNEEELAEEMWANIERGNFTTPWNKNVTFSLWFLSFEVEKIKEFNDILINIEASYSSEPTILSLVKQYRAGRISVIDFLIEVREQVKKNLPNDLEKFEHSTKKFNILQEEKLQNEMLDTSNSATSYREEVSLLLITTSSNQINQVRRILDNTKSKEIIFLKNSNLRKVKTFFTQTLTTDFIDDGKIISPLYLACHEGFTEITKMLLLNDANVNEIVNEESPLLAACKNGYLDIVILLLKHGANPTKPQLQLPINVASRAGHHEIVEYLIKNHHVDVNAAESNTSTPLFIASQNNHPEVVKILLAHNAAPSKPFTTTTESLYQFAKDNNKVNEIDTFIQHQLKMGQTPDKITMTPVEIATIMHNDQIVNLLQQSILYTQKKF